jgi:hypothetical protein
MAIVIWFTYLETKGLTLEQIDQRFEGVPRDQLVDVIQAYDGGKPISDKELVGIPVETEVEQVQVAAPKEVKG